MGRLIQIRSGQRGVSLPDGGVYKAGAQVSLTNAQWALVPGGWVGTIVNDLGSVPEPADSNATDAELAAAIAAIPTDGAAGTASLRTLGTAGTQALPGNHASTTDTRVPTDGSVTLAKLAAAARANLHGFALGEWHQPGSGSGTPSAILGVGTERLAAYWIPVACTLVAMRAETTVAGETGSVFRCIARLDDGSGASFGAPGKPSTLLAEGTVAGDGAVGVKETAALAGAIAAGGRWIWIGGAVQVVVTTQPTMRTIGTPLYALPMGSTAPTVLSAAYAGYSQTGVTGTPPAGWTGATLAGTIPRVAFKVT